MDANTKTDELFSSLLFRLMDGDGIVRLLAGAELVIELDFERDSAVFYSLCGDFVKRADCDGIRETLLPWTLDNVDEAAQSGFFALLSGAEQQCFGREPLVFWSRSLPKRRFSAALLQLSRRRYACRICEWSL